jgi:hypothetical protein
MYRVSQHAARSAEPARTPPFNGTVPPARPSPRNPADDARQYAQARRPIRVEATCEAGLLALRFGQDGICCVIAFPL